MLKSAIAAAALVVMSIPCYAANDYPSATMRTSMLSRARGEGLEGLPDAWCSRRCT
jgi:hypothetical protein